LTYRHLEGDAAEAYLEKNRSGIERAWELEGSARYMAKERSAAERARESQDMTSEEKRQEIGERSARIKAIARGVMTENR
jgi:hypothetical protein